MKIELFACLWLLANLSGTSVTTQRRLTSLDQVAQADQPQAETRLSFRPLKSNGTPVVNIELISGNNGTFLFDTGVSACTMTDAEAYQLGLSSRPAIGSDGLPLKYQGKPQNLVIVPNLRIGTWNLTNVPFLVIPEKDLTRMCGEPIQGILGANLIWSFPVMFDFQQREITMWMNGSLTETNLAAHGFSSADSIPIQEKPLKLVHMARVRFNDQQDEDMVIDTGAAWTLISHSLARSLHLKTNEQPKPYPTLQEGTISIKSAQIKRMQIGGQSISNVEVGVPQNDKYILHNLLGLDVLSRFRVLLDLPGKRLYLRPTTAKDDKR